MSVWNYLQYSLGKAGIHFSLIRETGMRRWSGKAPHCALQTSFDAQLKPASGSRADPAARPVI